MKSHDFSDGVAVPLGLAMQNEHPEQQALSDYALGKLDEQRAAVVGSHVADCPECEVTLQGIEGQTDTLVSGLRGDQKSAAEVFAQEEAYQRAIEQAANLPEVTAIHGQPTKISAALPGAADENLAKKLGPYELLAKLGEGGMGAVYRAQHEHLGKMVAIKILPAVAMRDPALVGRFRREMKAVGALHHPNIVGAHDAGEAAGVHFLVMEYVAGKDLSTVLKELGPLSVEQAISCTLQAARGLEFAHRKGIVHRDIKPANLLLDEEGTLKILDMGLARLDDNAHNIAAQEGLTQSGQVMGTVDYMAPEQAFDTHRADAKADVYSLGCTLYRLLTGQNAYAGDTIVQKILAHREKPIPSLRAARPEVPAALDKLFQQMLAKQTDERISMSDVVKELTALQASPSPATESFHLKQTPALSPTPVVQSGGGQRKIPGVWLAAGFGAAAALILLTIVFIIRDKDDKEIARVNGPDGSSVTVQQGTSQDKVKSVNSIQKIENYALHFDGTKSYVSIPTLSGEIDAPHTIEAYVTPARIGTTISDRYQAIMRLNGERETGLNQDYDLIKAHRFDGRSNSYQYQTSKPDPTLVNRRIHIANVSDGSRATLYVDGVPSTVQPKSGPRQASERGAYIGMASAPMKDGSLIDPFSGVIDEIRISKTARYYKAFTPAPRFQSDSDTVALYHFDEGTGDILRDASGNGHDGKIVGAKWMRADATPLLAQTLNPTRVDADPAFEQWVKETAALPYTQQLEAFRKKMIELNPGFDGKFGGTSGGSPKIENGVVTDIGFKTDQVTNLAPIRALTGLRALSCDGAYLNNRHTGKLVDLSPLQGLPLTYLNMGFNKVTDLAPLRRMPLTELVIVDNHVSDLTPLTGMPLTKLAYNNCGRITDLAPLRGMKLIHLGINSAKAADLTPLAGMPLEKFQYAGGPATDFSVLRGMPLTMLDLSNTKFSDYSSLTEYKNLKLLIVRGLNITPAEVAKLQAALPKCKIEWDAPSTGSVGVTPAVPPRTPLPDGLAGELVKELKFPDEPAAIALAPDGVHLAAVFREKVQWRNIPDDKVVWERPAAQSLAVHSLKVSPDGKFLVAAGWRQSLMDTVLLLRTSDGQRERAFSTPTGVRSAAISPDSQQLALGLADGTIQILDLTSGMIRHEIKAHLFEVQTLTFSPDGNRLASGSTTRADTPRTPENLKSRLKYWNVSDGTEFQTGITPSDFSYYSLRYTPDGQKLVVGSTVTYTTVLAADGSKLKSLGSEKKTGIWNAVPTASNRHAVFGNKIAFVAELDTGKTIFEFDESGIIEGMEVTPDGRFVVTRIDKDSSIYIHRLPAECAAANLPKAVTATSATPSANAAQKFAFEQPDFAAWAEEVGRRDPETQLAMVLKKLQELNPQYDGEETHRIQNNGVVELVLPATKIADLSPVRALVDLKSLKVGGEEQNHGLLKSVAPLRGMKLEKLEFYYTDVADLAPLRGMPLTGLICFGTKVTDLGALAGMPLSLLWIYQNPGITDLSPLRGAPLETLFAFNTGISDLTPLADSPLEIVRCNGTPVSDLTPLGGKDIMRLEIAETKVTDLAPLEKCAKLKRLEIQGLKIPAEEIEKLQKSLPSCRITSDPGTE